MTRRPRAGFTAEELMAVLAFIFIAMSIFLFAARNVRETASMSSCASNLKQLALAAQMYMADNSGRMPPPSEMTGGLMVYVKNQQVLLCPTAGSARRRRGEASGDADGKPPYLTDYVFNAAAQADDPAGTLVAGDDAPRHLRHTWLGARVDGGIRRFDAAQWDGYWGEVSRDEPKP